MEHQILPVSSDACREAASVLGRAFWDNPIPVALFQGLPEHERIRRITIGFAADLAICARKGIPLCIKDQNSIIAVAVIYPPGSYPLPFINQVQMIIKTILGTGVYGLQRWAAYMSSVESLHPKQPHYYLEYLGVEQEYQGKGLGSALLKFLTEKADSEQMGCYLENANPRNNPLYQHFGFVVTAENDILGVHNWFMWRTPRMFAA